MYNIYVEEKKRNEQLQKEKESAKITKYKNKFKRK